MRTLFSCAAAVLLFCTCAASAVLAEDPPIFLLKWGSTGTGDGEFNTPTGIAVDDSSYVYVADRGNNRIQKFTSDGTFILEWGSSGSGDGQINFPNGIAVDENGDIYVVDTSNNRIQKFASDGTFIAKWGSSGSGDGQFSTPWGIATDCTGNVYVVEGGNNRVQKFASDGTFLTKWGSYGSGYGQFANPLDITVSGNTVYVSDGGNSRIQRFTTSGVFIGMWGSSGSQDGQFSQPCGIAGEGNIYVADRGNNRIQKFAGNGAFLTKWGSGGSGEGQFSYLHYIAEDAVGNIYVVDTGNNRIQKFRAFVETETPPPFVVKWGSNGSGNGQFYLPQHLAVDGAGNIFVVEYGNHRVQKFTRGGTFVTKWGAYGSGDSQFANPRGVAVDGDGNVYVADSGNHRIQKFTNGGAFLEKWGSYGSGDGEFNWPMAIAIDADGKIYVVEQYNHRVQILTNDGAHLATWGSYGSGDGQLNQPLGIAIGSGGDVYIAEWGNCRIQKFTADGAFLAKWGSFGPLNGQFNRPWGIAVDAVGNVYVSDHYNSRIQKFTSEGLFVTKWGSAGSGDGQFNVPSGIVLDAIGNIYVSELDNHRIQRFGFLRSEPMILSISDVPADQGGKVSLAWQASMFDFIEMRAISHYSVWRSLGALPAASPAAEKPPVVLPTAIASDFRGPAYRVDHTPAGDYYWEWIANQDAYCFGGYSLTCATLFDSVTANPGMHVFQVLAHSSNGSDFWASAPDSGYSVDNLHPGAVMDLIGLGVLSPPPQALRLIWDPNAESDVSHYAIHKELSKDFVPGPSNLLAETAENELLDESWRIWDGHYYKIAAVDIHGNIGPYTLLKPNDIVIGVLLQTYEAALTQSGIEITWTLVAPLEKTANHVLRCSPPNQDFAELSQEQIEQDNLTFTFVDENVEPGTMYKYRVEVEEPSGRRTLLFETQSISTPDAPLTLFQNHPNPFNPATTITYYLPAPAQITLCIYDPAGRLVNRLFERETQQRGMHRVEWKGEDSQGRPVSSGVYFYRLETGKETLSKKMVLLR